MYNVPLMFHADPDAAALKGSETRRYMAVLIGRQAHESDHTYTRCHKAGTVNLHVTQLLQTPLGRENGHEHS